MALVNERAETDGYEALAPDSALMEVACSPPDCAPRSEGCGAEVSSESGVQIAGPVVAGDNLSS
eukprot:10206163-Lingulodinium_polyedra.AAC.1